MGQGYHDFCNVISSVAKRSIPRGRRNNHIPCWHAECKNLYRVFLRSSEGSNFGRAATALLIRLDRERMNRWPKAVQNIDFSHSSQKACSILKNLTGRSQHSPRSHPVLAAPSHISWLETGDIRMLIASCLDSYLKRCLTSGGSQHQVK